MGVMKHDQAIQVSVLSQYMTGKAAYCMLCLKTCETNHVMEVRFVLKAVVSTSQRQHDVA